MKNRSPAADPVAPRPHPSAVTCANRIVVMGVTGSGKSTVGSTLADRLGARFVDADDLHPPRNIELMRRGVPLTDADRWPWLDRVAAELAAPDRSTVVACSALRRRYRDAIRRRAPQAVFVLLDGPPALLTERLAARTGHFMPASLLRSQLATLEPLAPDETGTRLDLRDGPATLVERAIGYLTGASGTPQV